MHKLRYHKEITQLLNISFEPSQSLQQTGSIDGLSPFTTSGAPDGEPHSTPNPERACGPTPD
jgi:hypothetical protein